MNHSQCINGVAIADYYCMSKDVNEQEIMQSTEAELFANIESNSTQSYWNNYIQEQYDQINKKDNFTGHDGKPLELIGYEFGWGCVPPNDGNQANITAKYNDMVSSAEVANTVSMYLKDFHAINNGALVNAFSYIGWGGKYGDWGHLQWQDSYSKPQQDGSYKFQGIQQYLNN